MNQNQYYYNGRTPLSALVSPNTFYAAFELSHATVDYVLGNTANPELKKPNQEPEEANPELEKANQALEELAQHFEREKQKGEAFDRNVAVTYITRAENQLNKILEDQKPLTLENKKQRLGQVWQLIGLHHEITSTYQSWPGLIQRTYAQDIINLLASMNNFIKKAVIQYEILHDVRINDRAQVFTTLEELEGEFKEGMSKIARGSAASNSGQQSWSYDDFYYSVAIWTKITDIVISELGKYSLTLAEPNTTISDPGVTQTEEIETDDAILTQEEREQEEKKRDEECMWGPTILRFLLVAGFVSGIILLIADGVKYGDLPNLTALINDINYSLSSMGYDKLSYLEFFVENRQWHIFMKDIVGNQEVFSIAEQEWLNLINSLNNASLIPDGNVLTYYDFLYEKHLALSITGGVLGVVSALVVAVGAIALCARS